MQKQLRKKQMTTLKQPMFISIGEDTFIFICKNFEEEYFYQHIQSFRIMRVTDINNIVINCVNFLQALKN